MAIPTALSDSIARHERYHAADPSNALLLRALGDLYHRAGEFARALATYEQCLAIEPENAATRGRIAAVCISTWNFDEAEKSLRQLLAGSERDPVLLHNLGIALYFQKRYPEAADMLQKARDGGVVDPDNLHFLAYALHQMGDTARALEVTDAWLRLAPTAAVAGYRALLQMDDGDVIAAVTAAEEVVARDPENSNANLVLGIWETEQQDIDDAAKRFQRLTQAEPDNGRAWVGMALVHLYRSEHEASIACFQRALDAMPNNVGTLVALAWAHFTAKQIAESERTFRRAILVEPRFGEAHGGLALTLVWQNRRDEARREIALARRLDPKGFGVIYARSVLLGLEGQREQGEALLARTLEGSLRPDGPSITDNIRLFLRRQPAQPASTPKRLPQRY